MAGSVKELDPTEVEVGDVISAMWDDDESGDSCHCSIRVLVERGRPVAEAEHVAVVIAHNLEPRDIIRAVHERGDSEHCHCDVYFGVERTH